MFKTTTILMMLVAVAIVSAAGWRSANDGSVTAAPVVGKEGKGPARDVKYYESKSCYGCHNKEQPFVDPVVSPIICRCNEFDIWETADKHRLAYVALKGKRAEIMGKLLKIDVLNDKSCVACHGVWIEDEPTRQKRRGLVEEGVGCFSCHGQDHGWLDMHGSNNEERRLEWRDKSRAEKQTMFGMTDLWDPVKRTKLCASCHIGNAQEGKVLTHDMYAAGHPPLPSFDMSNFSDAMRHWEYLGEKKPEVIKKFKFTPAEVQLEQANLVYIGNLVSFQENLRLIEGVAKTKNAWPELALYDCYACHHDLKSDSWRQKRGYEGKPGRPQMQAWPIALVELALHHSASGDAKNAEVSVEAFNAKLKKLRAAYDDKPFGDPEQIAMAARDLADWIELKAKETSAAKELDPGAYNRLLTQLLDRHKERYVDYDAARQVTGAIRAIYAEGFKKTQDKEVLALLKSLDDELQVTLSSDARKGHREARLAITKDLAKLRKTKPMELSDFLARNLLPLQENYSAELEVFLKGVNNYDAERFRNKMRQLSATMSKKDK